MIEQKLVTAYKTGTLNEVIRDEIRTIKDIPTSMSFIKAFSHGHISEDDLDIVPDLYMEIARLLNQHAHELEQLKRQRARSMKPKKMHLITKPQKK